MLFFDDEPESSESEDGFYDDMTLVYFGSPKNLDEEFINAMFNKNWNRILELLEYPAFDRKVMETFYVRRGEDGHKFQIVSKYRDAGGEGMLCIIKSKSIDPNDTSYDSPISVVEALQKLIPDKSDHPLFSYENLPESWVTKKVPPVEKMRFSVMA